MTSLPNPFDHTHLASRTDFSIFFLPIIILIYVIASAPGCRLECTFKGDEIFIACLWSFCKSESMVGNSRTDYLTLHKRKVSFTECVDVQCLGIITCSVLIIPTSIWRTHFHLQRDAKLIYYGNAKMACCILVLYFTEKIILKDIWDKIKCHLKASPLLHYHHHQRILLPKINLLSQFL